MKTFRKQYRIKKRKSIFRFLKNRFFWLGFLILASAGGIFYLFCFYPKIQIREIKVYGPEGKLSASYGVNNQGISFEDIQRLVEEKISHKILFFYSRSIFLVNSREIKNTLFEKYPQIESLNLKRNFPSTLFLEIIERTPVGIWCMGETQKCFSFDKEGIIFAANPEISFNGSVNSPQEILKITDFMEKESPNLGEGIIDKNLLSSIENIKTNLKEINVVPVEFVLPDEEGRLNVKTVSDFEIYFNSKDDLNWQTTELSQVLEKEIPQKNWGNLEYIDLRFSKIYYKYR